MICERPNLPSVLQDVVREANLGQRKIIMGSQISLEEVVAFFFDSKIKILCEAADFVVLPSFMSLQCNLFSFLQTSCAFSQCFI